MPARGRDGPGQLVLTRSDVERKATVRNSPCCQSPRSALGRAQMTNGARKPSGIGSFCSGHFWQSVSLRLSRRALTCSSKALSLARPTNNRTAKARSRRPRRLRRGPSALMSCVRFRCLRGSPRAQTAAKTGDSKSNVGTPAMRVPTRKGRNLPAVGKTIGDRVRKNRPSDFD
jgi:hypothetical protein